MRRHVSAVGKRAAVTGGRAIPGAVVARSVVQVTVALLVVIPVICTLLRTGAAACAAPVRPTRTRATAASRPAGRNQHKRIIDDSFHPAPG